MDKNNTPISQDIFDLFIETLRFGSISIIHSKIFTRDSSWRTKHVLDNHEIFYVIEGKLELVINETHYSIEKNTIFLIPANTYKDLYIKSNKKATFFCMQFKSEACGSQYFNYVPFCPPIDAKSYEKDLEHIAKEMMSIGEPMSHYQVFKRLSLGAELLSIFFDLADPGNIIPTKKSRIDMQKIISHIDAKYRYENIKISQLAAILNISEGYFRKEFKKQYGVSCKTYINNRRMEGVLKMLRESNTPLCNIADNFMYSSSSFLSRQVKKYTGLSPTEYRKKYYKAPNKV